MTAPKPPILKIVKNRLDVAFLPGLVAPESLAQRTVIVTDVLRATTTIVNAVAHGCREVLPQPTIEAAREAHRNHPGSILGGERGGRIVDGFHHGNSPVEYTPEVVRDRTLILATTNGTVAMEHCRQAKRVLIGAMTNLGALVDLIGPDELVTVVCSGTDGFVTGEDVMFAGAFTERLMQRLHGGNLETAPAWNAVEGEWRKMGDMAQIAVNHWQNTCRLVESGHRLADFFRTARGGINLVKIGHDRDIEFAARIDSVPVVPELDLDRWRIRRHVPETREV